MLRFVLCIKKKKDGKIATLLSPLMKIKYLHKSSAWDRMRLKSSFYK